ncbi:hypothetical protein [Desulfobulbus sp.]|uniref:hypothetical protein n=1 Tax=Desulfobulbus sp. TaxID=895 RepID=UPI00286EEFD2|nr:hypothetical protein [Desulfobulbus sp.]
MEDKINALRCGAGHNIRLVLRKLRKKLPLLFAEWLFALWRCSDGQKNGDELFAPAK